MPELTPTPSPVPEVPITPESSFSYTISDGAVTITGFHGTETDVSIPMTIEGLPVTTIGESAFERCSSIVSVTIPNTVTSILLAAFAECPNLVNIEIPDSVLLIDDLAFVACNALEHIEIPGSVTRIGLCAISECAALKSIVIGDGEMTIDDYAFGYNPSLTSIHLPYGLTRLGEGLFSDCSSLETLTIPNSVTYISPYSLSYCGIKSIVIPDSVEYIEIGAFSGCASLVYIKLSENLQDVHDIFEECVSLSSVYIPESVTRISSYAFDDCSPDLVLYGVKGSYAETYANKEKIPFAVYVEPTPTPSPTPTPTPTPACSYRALLIANTYGGTDDPLNAPGRSVAGMRTMLSDKSSTPYAITTKYNLNASDIVAAIRDAFAGATENDISLFYFTGHGLSDTGELVGNDGTSYLRFVKLRNVLDEIPGKKIVLLESCHSGNSIGRSVDSANIMSELNAFNAQAIAAFSSMSRSGELASTPYYVLTAASADEVGYEVELNGTWVGLFNYSLLYGSGYDVLNSVGIALNADQNADRQITLSEAYSYLRIKVKEVLASSNLVIPNVQVYPSGSSMVLWGK